MVTDLEIVVSEVFFKGVNKALRATGLNFCLAWGTCLAAIRDKKLIPWDLEEFDFSSVGALPEDGMNSIEAKLRSCGLGCLWYFTTRPSLWYSLSIWDIPSPSRSKEISKAMRDLDLHGFAFIPARRAHVDFYKDFNGEVIEAFHIEPVLEGPRFPTRLFESPLEMEFLGQKVRVPNPPEEYLRLAYGKDWRIPKKDGWINDWRDNP